MRPSEYVEAKATLDRIFDLAIRSPRAWHVDTANVGTWEIQTRQDMMLNDKIKNDNFKTSHTSRMEVRSTRSSVEVE